MRPIDSLNVCGTISTPIYQHRIINTDLLTPIYQHRFVNTELSTPIYQHRGLTHEWMHEHIFRHQLNAQTMNQTTPK